MKLLRSHLVVPIILAVIVLFSALSLVSGDTERRRTDDNENHAVESEQREPAHRHHQPHITQNDHGLDEARVQNVDRLLLQNKARRVMMNAEAAEEEDGNELLDEYVDGGDDFSIFDGTDLREMMNMLNEDGELEVQMIMLDEDGNEIETSQVWTLDDMMEAAEYLLQRVRDDIDEMESYFEPDAPAIQVFEGPIAFDGGEGLSFPTWNTTALQYTTAFWVYLTQNPTESWRCLMHRGDDSYDRGPGIYLPPSALPSFLHTSVSTLYARSETLDSLTELPLHQWTHVTVVVGNDRKSGSDVELPFLAIYLNGTLDADRFLAGVPVPINGSIHVAKDPWYAATGCILFDMQMHADALTLEEIYDLFNRTVPPMPDLDESLLVTERATLPTVPSPSPRAIALDPTLSGTDPISCCSSSSLMEDTYADTTSSMYDHEEEEEGEGENGKESLNEEASLAIADKTLTERRKPTVDYIKLGDRVRMGPEVQEKEVDLTALQYFVAQNESSALYALGCMYLFGEIYSVDINASVTYLTRSASLGCVQAMHAVAVLYNAGLGVEKNVPLALSYLRLAVAKGGFGESAMTMGFNHHYGPPNNPDYLGMGVWELDNDAILHMQYYRIGAREAMARPQAFTQHIALSDEMDLSLGQSGEDDHIVQLEKDYADNRGDVGAMMRLGTMYYYGTNGVPIDYEQSFHYYEAAAQHDHPDALAAVGKLYTKGEGVAQSNDTGLEYFRRAVAKDSVDGLNGLGYMYYHGNIVEQNYTAALEYWLRAVEQGNTDAMYNAALLYLRGYGTEVNQTRAVELLTPAAQAGHRAAVHQMAFMALYGWGMPKSITLAAQYFETNTWWGEWNALLMKRAHERFLHGQHWAALMGYEFASFLGHETPTYNAAWLYDNGRGNADIVSKEYRDKRAFYLYQRSALLTANRNSFAKIGDYYFEGRGVEANLTLAAGSYRRAALAGSAAGFFYLGYCYQYGYGVEKDTETARSFYTQAAIYDPQAWLISTGAVWYLDLQEMNWSETLRNATLGRVAALYRKVPSWVAAREALTLGLGRVKGFVFGGKSQVQLDTVLIFSVGVILLGALIVRRLRRNPDAALAAPPLQPPQQQAHAVQ